MRHKGSISQVNIERDRMVPVLFRKAKSLVAWPTKMSVICELVANMPVTEFFISSDTAIVYVRNRYGGKEVRPFQSQYKQLLYDTLYDRFLELMEKNRKRKSIPYVVQLALASSAPCLGISPYQVYQIMLRHKKLLKQRP